MFVTIMTPNALNVTRSEFTKFTVKDGFSFLVSSRKRDGANVVIVPCQGCGLIVIQLLLDIWRF